jgi:hypothetical protein
MTDNRILSTLVDSTIAGKNKIINGDFGIWQRGTTFSNPTSGDFLSDRFYSQHNGTGTTRTITQQTFTPGTAPVAGYEGQYYQRYALSVVGTSTFNRVCQNIEDVRTFAGQTVTVSMWLKSSTTQNVSFNLSQLFGTGGSSENYFGNSNFNITTSWVRYSATFAVPSVSGKTIGTSSFMKFFLELNASSTYTAEMWGLQIEAGSVATAFQTATGTIQGELAACQRYYYRTGVGLGDTTPAIYEPLGYGSFFNSTIFVGQCEFPVTMRIKTGSVQFSNVAINTATSAFAVTNVVVDAGGLNRSQINLTIATGGTANIFGRIQNNNSTAGYLAWSAEL